MVGEIELHYELLNWVYFFFGSLFELDSIVRSIVERLQKHPNGSTAEQPGLNKFKK